MARSVDKVQGVGLAVQGRVFQGYRVGLDGDATLPLQVHVIQDLGLHIAPRHRLGQFQQAIGQRGFAMINVRDDGEIADESGI